MCEEVVQRGRGGQRKRLSSLAVVTLLLQVVVVVVVVVVTFLMLIVVAFSSVVVLLSVWVVVVLLSEVSVDTLPAVGGGRTGGPLFYAENVRTGRRWGGTCREIERVWAATVSS